MRDLFPLSRSRLRWLCILCESTGLRAAELIAARREHIHVTRAGALLEVIGKGSRAREVPLPKAAIEATREYFAAREIDFDSAPPETPLLGSLRDSTQPLTYSSLYETFTRFVRRAVEQCSLEPDQQRAALKASLHWLRHTHATRFAERGGDLDVLQANLGHSDLRTSARREPTQRAGTVSALRFNTIALCAIYRCGALVQAASAGRLCGGSDLAGSGRRGQGERMTLLRVGLPALPRSA